MDLEKLRIERAEVKIAPAGGRPGGRFPLGLLLGIPAVCVALWLFGPRLVDWADRMRLPTVKIAPAVERNAAAAGALTGAAANGYIVARTRAALSADAPGRIVEINVEEGSTVAKGDVVARLYWREHEANLRRSEADLAAAQLGARRAESTHIASEAAVEEARSHARRTDADLGRVGELVEQGFENQSTLDRVRDDAQTAHARLAVTQAESSAANAGREERMALVDAAVAARDLALATLEKTYLRAPFDGVVVLKNAEVGEVVSPNSTGGTNARGSVVTMVDFASLEVQAHVPETSLDRVSVNAPATVYLDAWPGHPYAGHVSRIWPTADRVKGTVEVRILLDELDERLRPDMGVRVVFHGGTEDGRGGSKLGEGVVLVPLEALTRRDGSRGVFSLEGNRVRWRTVEVVREFGGRAVLAAGLEAGESVVLDPPLDLEDGERVVPVE
jgi:RND family efflux transporter MFP subunit